MWWLVIIVFAFLIPEILSTILESRIGRAVAARIESRGRAGGSDGLQDRVRYLEAEFFQKLLTERASGGGPEHNPGDRAF